MSIKNIPGPEGGRPATELWFTLMSLSFIPLLLAFVVPMPLKIPLIVCMALLASAGLVLLARRGLF